MINVISREKKMVMMRCTEEEFEKESPGRRGDYKLLRHCCDHVWGDLWSAKAKGSVCESARKLRVFAGIEKPFSPGSPLASASSLDFRKQAH